MEDQSQNTSVSGNIGRGSVTTAAFDTPEPALATSTQATTLQPPDFSRPIPSTAPIAKVVSTQTPRNKRKKWMMITGITLAIAVVMVGGILLYRNSQSTVLSTQNSTNASTRFDTLNIPLQEFSSTGPLVIDSSRTLSINGQLKVNNGFVVAPSAKPTAAVAGQIYYDETTNQLNYYNGSGFISLISEPNVSSISGATGSLTLGNGLSLAGTQLSNNGVLSVQGQTGSISLIAGPGVVIDGTTLSSSGVLSMGGTNGAITIGAGLGMSGNQLRNNGIIGISSSSTNIIVTNDGSGNITLSSGAGGAVQSPGGATGRIAKFTGAQTIADSILSESGTTITVNGDLAVTGALALGTPLAVASGGTGASSLTVNGVLIGNNTGAVSSVTASSAGQCLLSTAGAPSWQTCPSGSSGANTALSNLVGVAINTSLLPGSAGGINLGSGSLPVGSIYLAGSSGTPAVNNFQLTGASTSGTRTITLPDASGTVCLQSSTNCGFIQNTTTVQTNANVAIQSAADGNITMLLRERATQSADLLRIEDASSNYQLRIDAYGSMQLAQAANIGRYMGIGIAGSSGEQLRIAVADASVIGLSLYGNGSQTADLLRITAGGALPILAISGSGQSAFQNRTNSTTALTVSNAASQNILRVDTTNNLTVLGDNTGAAGGLSVSDGTNFVTITSATLGAARSVSLPDSSGTVCLSSGNCGAAIGTLQAAYTFSTGGSTPEIKLDSIRQGLDFQDADSTIGSSANFLSLRSSNASGLGGIVFGWGIQGDYFQKPTVDKTTAFRVQSSIADNIFSIDTTNGRVGINLGGANDPNYTLEIKGDLNVGTGVYRSGGSAGLTATTCTGGQVLQNQAVLGGIVTSGTCTANGGSLQAAYNASTSPEIVLNATNGALTLRDAASPIAANLLEVQDNSGTNTYFAVSAASTIVRSPLTVKPLTGADGVVFAVRSSTDNNAFTADTSTSRFGFGLGGSNMPALTNSGIEVLGAIRLSGTTSTYMDTYTTPVGTGVNTKINIPSQDPGAYGQLLALGVPSTANATSRIISIFDARTAAHQPSIGVFSPDESNIAGFSWEGGNSDAYLKTTGGNLVMRSNTTDIMTLLSGGSVGVGVSPTYKMDVAGDINSTTALRIAGTSICDSTGCTAKSGSTYYIQNGTGLQSANFAVQAATSGSVAAVIQANAAGSGDILDLKNGSGTAIATFSSIGAILFQNSFDSINALAVKNAAGTSTILNVDSTNGRVGIGGVSGFSKLEVQGGEAAIYNSGNNPRLILGDTTSDYGWLQWDSANDYFRIETVGSNGLKVKDNNVSIGNIFPGEPLTVGSGTTQLFQINSTGAIVSKNSTDSAAAFQIQNSAGTSLFTANTTSGNISVTNSLSVGGEISAATMSGAGLTSCSALNSKLLWNSTSKTFSCGTDRASFVTQKATDETVNNSAVLQNDNDFTFSIGANETWSFQIYGAVASSAAADFQSTVTAPSGATCRVDYNDLYNVQNTHITTCGSTTGTIPHAGTTDEQYIIYGTITNGANAGTVTLQWAQGTATAVNTTFRAGSHMVAFKVNGADVAEAYYTKDSSISPGDVVQVDGSLKAGVKKSNTPYSTSAIGIVSTQPGFVLGDSTATTSTGKPVLLALNGRVPVKVSTENGPISAGDYLTTSSKPGIAMKATKAGQMIGTALEGYTGDSPSGIGLISAFSNLTWADPTNNGIQGAAGVQDNIGGTNLNISGDATINNLTVTGTATIAELHATDVVVSANLTVNGHIISGGNSPKITTNSACYDAAARIDGTDTAGLITFTTTANCSIDGELAKVNFNKAFAAAPRVTLTPANANASGIKTYVDSDATTPSGFTIAAPTANANGPTTYKWYYQVIQ